MKETVDTLVPLTPFLLALLALLIPSAADRLKYKKEAADSTPVAPPVLQGKSVDFEKEYVTDVKQRIAEQRAEIVELERKLGNCTCGAVKS